MLFMQMNQPLSAAFPLLLGAMGTYVAEVFVPDQLTAQPVKEHYFDVNAMHSQVVPVLFFEQMMEF